MALRKRFVVLGCIIFLLSGCVEKDQTKFGTGNIVKERGTMEKSIEHITPQAAKELLAGNKTAILVDVRTPEENKEIRIPGSLLIPLDTIKTSAEAKLHNKETPVVVYCRSGRRSTSAAKELSALGYQRIYDMGGINDWPYETEKGP